MVFSSYIFLFFFLPVALAGYYALSKWSGRKVSRIFLVCMCGLFYGWFNIDYLWILIISILFNYFLSMILSGTNGAGRKWLYILGIAGNLGLLGYFKYYDFFIFNINFIFESDFLLKNILLPLGISFFTFQQISYLHEIYSGKLSKNYSFTDYTLFVAFFPQLIAGPIVMPEEMMSQFAKEDSHRFQPENFAPGLWLFAAGLAKKTILADTFAVWADDRFALEALSSPEAWQATFGYMLQIYFDFSGYCDMAMGIGLMYNVRLPLNFDMPYQASNIQDFWKRWHITLGRFLASFVYFPLGGSRSGQARTLVNLFLTFLVSGIWHGAGWLFILWGALHGAAIVLHRIWWDILHFRMPVWCGRILTFIFVMLAWVLFRAETLEQAKTMYGALFKINISDFIVYFSDFSAFESFLVFWGTLGLLFLPLSAARLAEKFKPNLLNGILTIFLIVSSIFMLTRESPFIYYNF